MTTIGGIHFKYQEQGGLTMEQDQIGTFLFEGQLGQDILANDGTDFSKPYFEQAAILLQGYRALNFLGDARLFPKDYQEDLVQAARRGNFHLSDWLSAAITLNAQGYLVNALLLEKSHRQEGGVFDFSRQGLAIAFYRGFRIKESDDSPTLSGEDYLASLGVEAEVPVIEKPETALYFSGEDLPEDHGEDDEEEPHEILVARPAFEAGGKRKIVNLGGSETPSEVLEEENPEAAEEPTIHVARPAFEARGKGKIRNLGNAPTSSADEEEDNDETKNIAVARPAFEAGGHGKPVNLNATPDRPKKKAPMPSISHVEPTEEDEDNPAPIVTPRPAFEAVSTKKVPNLDAKPDTPKAPAPLESPAPANPEETMPKSVVSKPAFEAAGKKPIRNVDAVVAKEERNWSAIDVYKLKPNVYHRERSIIADPHDPSALDYCAKVKEKIGTLSSLAVSSDLVFVPAVLKENDPHLKALYHFDPSAWDLLALTVNGDEETLLVLLANQAEPNFCFVLSLKHEPIVECLSLKGASLDDLALPYLVYPALRKIVFPE